MNAFDPQQLALIAQLSNGEWISGSSIAQSLQLSREAVSKRVRKLSELGLSVEAQTGRGYRLKIPIQLLDAESIRATLPLECPVTVLSSTQSTNLWAAQQSVAPLLCFAEHQTAGRGRRGRTWQSPFGQNLYMSLRWELPRWPEKLPALSLAIGVALAQSFRSLEIPVQLKWPNDLYLNDRKFGGLLIEQRGEAHGPCHLVIGLGVNVAMQEHADIDQAWTSLHREGHTQDRNLLASALANTCIRELQQLSTASMEQRLKEFPHYDVFHNRDVVIDDGQQLIHGRAQGLDEWGRIGLQTATGLRHFSVGDVSLRAAR